MEEEMKTPVTEAAATAAEAAEEAINKAAECAAEAADTAAEAVEAAAEAAGEAVDAAAETAADTPEAAEEAASIPVPAVAGAEEKAESMADYEAELNASFRQINEGDKITGTVIGVDEDKITVDISYYTDGIIRREDISDDPDYNIQERIKVGQPIEATVIRTDDGHGHILLSMKEAATLAAWERLRSLKDSKESVTVRISGITKGGAIASLEGIRAFIPASKLSLGYVEENDLNDWLGKSIEARVITAQEEGSKLVLSAKEILREKEAEERRTRISNVQPGLVTEGTVETIKDYGAFINLGKGLSGLLHVSQIVNRRIKTPSEVLKEGDKVKVKVIAVKDGKLSLSMKALEEDAPAEEVVEVTFKLPESKEIGTSLGYQYVQDFGISTLTSGDNNQAMGIGGITNGVTNLDLTAAYATIANGGEYNTPIFYTTVVDHQGNIILDNRENSSRRVLKETTAWLLTSAMEDVMTKGTGTAANFDGMTAKRL